MPPESQCLCLISEGKKNHVITFLFVIYDRVYLDCVIIYIVNGYLTVGRYFTIVSLQ